MNDYISRVAVLEHLNKCKEDPLFDPDMARICFAISIFIENMAAADVQPVKRGKWESSQRTIETGTVYCSNCAIEYYISDLQTVGDCNGIVHYCPNCGARMDGDSE